MAEIAVSALLNTVFEKLASEALKQVVRSQGIHSELKTLGRKLSQIQAVLIDASHKEITDEAVKQWLNSLQHLAYDIDDVLDDLATEAMHRQLTQESVTSKVRKLIPTCCANLPLSNRLRHKLDDIATELEELENRKLGLGLMVKDDTPKNTSRRNETSLPDSNSIVGRKSDKEKFLQKLLDAEACDQNFSIVPIVGMGGVGKTTLARLLYNETQVKDHFIIRAWVCVSDELDIFKISKTIFQAVTGETKEFEDLNQLQIALREQLKDKLFLLVLDDVWSENYDDWENLVRPCHVGALGSRIIVTTRKEQLLKKLGFDHLDHLESLSNEDALSLFTLHALGVDNFDSHPTLKPQGEGIVKKCGGLPLALKALGRLLKTKEEKEDWDVVLNSEIWDLENVNSIVPALRLSYHDLPAHLKQLFVYCSLFPKDFLFNKEELVLLWMAEGYLNQLHANMSPEFFGNECFEKLLSRSFFQHAPSEESLFVMHDLMNDLATFVAGDFFLRFDNGMERVKGAIEKYRHMSFIREDYVAYPKFEPFRKAKCLRTLLSVSVGADESWNLFHISSKIFSDLLPELPLLRVLSLCGFEIKEVPEFISSLKHLRYFNLSQTKIKRLPENMCNLYNLETLIVFGCWSLTKLPKSFSNLKKLRHFDIRDTPLLKKMPLGIGELKSLRTLTKVIIGGDDSFAITELKRLENLHGEISIEGLHKVQSAMHAHEANLSLKMFTKLELKWGDVFDGSRRGTLEKEVLNELKPHSEKLKNLGVECYGGIEFPNWIGDPSFIWLVNISIRGCRKCTSLPPLGQLPSLKKLSIQGMNEIKVIGLELLGTTGIAFPSLEILEFEDMIGWEAWSTNNEVVDIVFPRLGELRIKNCPSLVGVSLRALHLLRVLKIGGCGDGVLTYLVQVASSITKLQIECISGLTDVVWRGVTEYLGAVEEVKIESCEKLRYLWESKAKASMVLVNLRKLEVSQCANLVSLGEKEDDDNFGSNILTSLRMLDISICDNLKNCSCPNDIESLRIFMCRSLTCVSFPKTGEGQKLKSLDLFDCDKLVGHINNANMPKLEDMIIFRWLNLKSISGLSNYVYVFRLIIKDCQSLESFPDLQLPHLTSLKHLEIVKCPNMDISFPRGLWPPKLRELEIGRLKKPISEWGPQNFPTSLVELTLDGEHVKNFSQLSHLFPSSLTIFCIRDFENLESLSVGLQHLTSLQHLIIHTCPKLKHLPETLLPSLLRLVILECTCLEERSRGRRSYYWPLVSHIPFISIQHDLLFSDSED